MLWVVTVFEPQHDKTNSDMCIQQRLRSVWASAQSDQSLRSQLSGKLRTQGFFMQTGKTLIRLDGCPGWSESSLGAQVILLVLSCCDSFWLETGKPWMTFPQIVTLFGSYLVTSDKFINTRHTLNYCIKNNKYFKGMLNIRSKKSNNKKISLDLTFYCDSWWVIVVSPVNYPDSES